MKSSIIKRLVSLLSCVTLDQGTSRNVSGISNPLLQQCCDGLSFSVLLFSFSASKEPAKELEFIIIYVRWEMCEQNISTIFRVWERWSVTKLNVQIRWTIGRNYPCRWLFHVQPPPTWISRVFDPPPARISRIPSVMGVWIFLDQPIIKKKPNIYKQNLTINSKSTN